MRRIYHLAIHAVRLSFLDLSLLSAIVVVWVSAASALAQCGATSPAGAASPWPVCTTWSGPSWQAYPNWSKNEMGVVPPTISAIDLNGDGMTDLFYTGGRLSPAFGVATSTGTSFNANITAPADPSTACYLGNFDGTGRTGIACVGAGTISYASSTGTGFGSFNTQTFSGGTLWGMNVSVIGISSPNPCFVMDVDGDGTDDLVCGSPASLQAPPGKDPAPSTAWGVYLSVGGTFKYQVWNGPTGGYTQSSFCLAGDFNGDGLKDLACSFNSSKNTWSMLLSTGSGWAVQTWTGPVSMNPAYFGTCQSTYGTANLCGPPCVVGDFDGDGIDDIACTYSANQWVIGFGGGSGGFKNGGAAIWTGATGLPAGTPALGSCLVSDVFGTGWSGFICVTNSGTSSTSLSWVRSAAILGP